MFLVNTGGVTYEADLADNLFDNNILLNQKSAAADLYGRG